MALPVTLSDLYFPEPSTPYAGQVVALRGEGALLLLRLEPYQELEGPINFTLAVAEADLPLGHEVAGFNLATPAGDLAHGPEGWVWPQDGQSPPKPVEVAWLEARWSGQRMATQASLSFSGLATHCRVKLYVNNGWTPAQPLDLLTPGATLKLAPTAAERVFFELLKENTAIPNLFTPATAAISGFSVLSAPMPGYLSIQVGEAPPFFQHNEPLQKGQPIQIKGLAAAVNRHLASLPPSPHPVFVPIRLASKVCGQVNLVEFSGHKVSHKRALEPSPATTGGGPWVLPRGRVLLGESDIGVDGLLEGLTLKLAGQPAPMAPHIAPIGPPRINSNQEAMMVAPGRQGAQGFAPLPPKTLLAAVDLLLMPLTPQVSGRLSLYPDQQGRPAPQPFENGTVELAFQAALPAPFGWRLCTLPAPLSLKDQPWWAVLELTEGEAAWLLDSHPAEGAVPPLWRQAAGAWRVKTGPDGLPAWAAASVWLAAKTPMAPKLVVWRNRVEEAAETGPDGRFTLSAESVDKLNTYPIQAQCDDATLELHLESSGGAFQLEGLDVAFDQPPPPPTP